METRNTVLLIGTSNSGKSHYGGQFEIRLAFSKGALRRRIVEGDTTLFKGVKDNLYRGLASEHTPTGTKTQKTLSLIADDGTEFDLAWQDYAGEQINDIFAERAIDDAWRRDIERSESWILFVRPSDIKVKKDMINQIPNRFVVEARPDGANPDTRKFEYSDQTKFVELLQLLLHANGGRRGAWLRRPRLTIVMSCWDEIDMTELNSSKGMHPRPVDVLKKYTPMVHDFVRNRWDQMSWSVLGVSSLGGELSTSEPDNEFAKQGPENAGFVVLEDGSESSDLTLIVSLSV